MQFMDDNYNRMKLILTILLFTASITLFSQDDAGNGIMYGQLVPVDRPEIFAKGIVSNAGSVEFTCSFTIGGELYFTRREKGDINRIYVTRFENGRWVTPVEATFTRNIWANHPAAAPDGKRLFFGSKLSLTGDSGPDNISSTWYIDRVNGEWTAPVMIGENIMKVSVSRNNNIYFTDKSAGFHGCFIAMMGKTDAGYSDPVRVEIPVTGAVAHPTISAGEDYIIFDSYIPGGFGQSDLYISFRSDEGKWSSPINLGEGINTDAIEDCAVLSACGKALFFSRNRSGETDIYWIAMQDILELNPHNREL